MEKIEYENIRASYKEVPKKNHYRALLRFGICTMPNMNKETDSNGNHNALMILLEESVYKSAIRAINDLGEDKWEFLRDFQNPNVNTNLIYCDHPVIKEITTKIYEYYDGNHSGGSMAYTIKTMQYLAKNEMQNLRYLRRRDYLLFTESLKMNGKPLMKNNDIIREIASFI